MAFILMCAQEEGATKCDLDFKVKGQSHNGYRFTFFVFDNPYPHYLIIKHGQQNRSSLSVNEQISLCRKQLFSHT